MTPIIYCGPHMNQSSWASLAGVPVTDVLQDSSEGLQILDKTRPAHTMVRPCPHRKKTQIKASCQDQALVACVVRHLRQVKSPFRFFSKKYCFSKFSFSGQGFHQKQTPGSIPGDAQAELQAIRSFIHACLVSSSSKFLDRLCHIHACNLTVNSPSDQVILSSCKHLLYNSTKSRR